MRSKELEAKRQAVVNARILHFIEVNLVDQVELAELERCCDASCHANVDYEQRANTDQGHLTGSLSPRLRNDILIHISVYVGCITILHIRNETDSMHVRLCDSRDINLLPR